MTEAKKMIKLVHEHLPNTKIIMNSLGLTNAEMDYLKSQRNVELRIFNFDKYPSMAFSKHNLFTYAWKPTVVKEASKKYEVIMYFDSSVRLNGSIDAGVFKYLQVYPGVVLGPWFGNNWSCGYIVYIVMMLWLFVNREQLVVATVIPW